MKFEAKPGDLVEINFIKKSYKGIFLESPEPGIFLLKTDSGYNLGFNKKDILNINVLKKFNPEKIKEIEITKDENKPNIAIVITGGTIASSYNSKVGGVTPLKSSSDLFKFYPQIFQKANVTKIEVPFMKDSSELNFSDWKKVAKIVEKLVNDSNISGVIIAHGTDTLHYASSCLSFFLRNLPKPVVLTYSQRSIDRASSDATLNLECSALAAISDIAEVMVVGHASSNDDFCYAIPGTKVRKMHSSKRDAFKSINKKPFAKIYTDRIEILSEYSKREKIKCKLDLNFEEKIALIKFYPGQDANILDYYLKNKYKGIVLEMFGLGQISKKWLVKLKEVQKKGLIICATSQTIYGRVNPLVYSIGREFLNTGVIYLEDMLSETALVKLGWVLGHKEWIKNKNAIKEKMLENFSREINDRLEE
ncbi:MAG: Glu-tRNA(Gln) amidotransferase subunit GatD [Candidatus Pacearchaeota archaeon]|jgi:glutamyl-tRNA(Gln) amidotransferase subunit D